MRFFALGEADAARAQDLQRGGRGNREAAMGAMDEASAFDDRAGEDARFAEHFKRNTGADDIDDGIDRADFVEVNFFRGQAVDTAFGVGDALENGDGFMFYPVGEGAGGD